MRGDTTFLNKAAVTRVKRSAVAEPNTTQREPYVHSHAGAGRLVNDRAVL
jgi:hypothetical protein